MKPCPCGWCKRIATLETKEAALLDLAEEAWGVIANAHEGNWHMAPRKWQRAAVHWRDRYRAALDAARTSQPAVPK